MGLIQTLQTLEVIMTEIVYRHNIALTHRVDTFHPPEIHLVVVDVPIHGFEEDINAMEIIMERRIAIVFFRTERHQPARLIVITETNVIVVNGIHLDSRQRIGQINTHGGAVRHQKLVHRHQETGRLDPHDLLAALAEMENGFFADAAKHIHLVAHHTNTTLEVDIVHQVRNGIIRTIRPHARKHRFLVRRVHQHFVLITAQDVLIEMLAFVENGRVDSVFRTAEVELVEIRQGDIYSRW